MPTVPHAFLAAALALAAFPAERTSVSPDHRYRVTWIAPPDAGGFHRLTLTDLRTKATAPLFSFMRHVELVWSPSSGDLALTDCRGSNESVVYVIKSSAPAVATPVSLPANVAASVAPHGHVYVRAVRWASSSELTVSVTAYDNPAVPTVEATFRYPVR